MLNSIFSILRNAAVAAIFALGASMATAEAKAPLNQTPDGIAMDGFDVVAYFTDGKPTKGDATFGVDHDGARWLFSS